MYFVFRFDGSATEISLRSDCSIAQLRTNGPDEFRTVPTGRYIMTQNGRRKEVTEGKEYKQTSAGRFEKSEWIRHMEEAVLCEGKAQLLKDIISHVTTHCAWLHAAKERRDYAMECLSSDAYKHWKDFKTGGRQ